MSISQAAWRDLKRQEEKLDKLIQECEWDGPRDVPHDCTYVIERKNPITERPDVMRYIARCAGAGCSIVWNKDKTRVKITGVQHG